jgi:PAS domain S-box-containing protein
MTRSPSPEATGASYLPAGKAGANRAENAEVAELRTQLREAHETIEAIRGGSVDSLVIGPPGQEQIYAVATADRLYRLIFEAAQEGLAAVSPRGVILDANPRLASMTGRFAPELRGTEVLDLISKACRPAFAGLVDVGAGQSAHGELELTGPGRTTVPVWLAVGGFDLDGMLVRFLIMTDLTAQRTEESKAAIAHEALRESEGRLSALFDNAPVGIDELTASGDLVRANPRFCAIVGYSAEELRGMRLQDISHPGDLDADLAGMRRLLSGEINTYSMDKRYLRNDGSVVWAEVNRAVVRNQDGSPLQLIGVVRDVTAQHRAEAEVRALTADLEARVLQRTADLERANKNLESFTYSVSHDLRSPLRALSGFSAALLEDCGDQLDETGRGYAERIEAASERMAALIDDLLLLSRVSRADMDLTPVDLSAEAAAVAEELQSGEPGRRIHLTIHDGVWVTADRALIRSVVQNLLENAWKFTSKRADATIEFGARASGDGEICYYVRDNGAGFDPAYRGKLFQPFQRLHAASEFPGTGIGLASVQRIIDRHGGRTWAEGAVDLGATFYFTLGTKSAG